MRTASYATGNGSQESKSNRMTFLAIQRSPKFIGDLTSPFEALITAFQLRYDRIQRTTASERPLTATADMSVLIPLWTPTGCMTAADWNPGDMIAYVVFLSKSTNLPSGFAFLESLPLGFSIQNSENICARMSWC